MALSICIYVVPILLVYALYIRSCRISNINSSWWCMANSENRGPCLCAVLCWDPGKSDPGFETAYIYICVYIYIYIYIYIHTYTCTCIHINIYVYIHIHIYVYIYTYLYACIYISTNIHMYVPRILSPEEPKQGSNAGLR